MDGAMMQFREADISFKFWATFFALSVPATV
jgi:hypothetical protein